MHTPPKLLLLGFLPFGEHTTNPSQMLVEIQLAAPPIEGLELTGLVLPVVLAEALDLASEAISAHKPDAIIALGLGGGPAIRLERVALNLADFRIPDEAGAQPTDQPVARGGPTAYLSTLPLRQIHEALLAQGIPTQLSETAGTYLCNALLYHLLHQAETHEAHETHETQAPPLAGFVHLPLLPAMVADDLRAGKAAQPSMDFGLMQRALLIALDTIRVYLTSREQDPSDHPSH